MLLNPLTEVQAAEYVAGLDLATGSEAARTIGSMLLLPKSAFARGISALAQGLITLSAVRSLPAMNERLLDALIAQRMRDGDPAVTAWRYREEWLPASVDVHALRQSAVGSAKSSVAAKYIDRWGSVVRPRYDFLSTDESRYHTYSEAYVAYMVIAGGQETEAQLATFRAAHDRLKAERPYLLRVDDANCQLLALVESTRTEPLFLEQANGGRPARPFLDWLMSSSWRAVEPGNFTRFMDEVAYPAMAASDDPARTGLPGVVALRAASQWSPVSWPGGGWELDCARMGRLYLPAAYGGRACPVASIETDRADGGALASYLQAASDAVSAIHAIIASRMAESAAGKRARAGSPSGLLLALTVPSK